MSRDEPVSITSLYGFHTRKGLVRVKVGKKLDQQWTSEEARRIAFMLLEAADAADGDSLIVLWATERMGLQMEQVGQLLADFRELRARQPSALAKTFSEIVEDP